MAPEVSLLRFLGPPGPVLNWRPRGPRRKTARGRTMRGVCGQLEDFSRWQQNTNRWALSFRAALMTMGVWHFAFILIGSYLDGGHRALMILQQHHRGSGTRGPRYWRLGCCIFKERYDAPSAHGELESSLGRGKAWCPAIGHHRRVPIPHLRWPKLFNF
jgi:hypothetical protein